MPGYLLELKTKGVTVLIFERRRPQGGRKSNFLAFVLFKFKVLMLD
jgi:phytoene dehydrogenase-like protein